MHRLEVTRIKRVTAWKTAFFKLIFFEYLMHVSDLMVLTKFD
jgi:hypothetical protein